MMKNIPEITGGLKNNIVEMPKEISKASGMLIFGKKIKSLIFTTDIAIIRNHNADAIMAVYPFTPQPIITEMIMAAADVPVFCGVGGGRTYSKRVVNLALDAEFKGAIGVVVNSPLPSEIVVAMREAIDIPIVVTIISENEDIDERIYSGANILNVSGAKNTPYIIEKIRKKYPEIPIISTGGPTEISIRDSINAGANAISYTPVSLTEMMKSTMNKYRREY